MAKPDENSTTPAADGPEEPNAAHTAREAALDAAEQPKAKKGKPARPNMIVHPHTGLPHHVKAGAVGGWFAAQVAHAQLGHVHNENCLEAAIESAQTILDTDEEFPAPESTVFAPAEEGATKPKAAKKK